jgi:hypothetical protein
VKGLCRRFRPDASVPDMAHEGDERAIQFRGPLANGVPARDEGHRGGKLLPRCSDICAGPHFLSKNHLRMAPSSCDAPPIVVRRGISGRIVCCIAVAMGVILSLGAMTGTARAASAAVSKPSGIFVFDAAGNATTAVKEVLAGSLPRQDVRGFDWTFSWSTLEPSPGAYQWNVLDNALAAATGAGFTSQLTVLPGTQAPPWVIAACPDVSVTLLHTQKVVTIAVPTTTCFLNDWTTFIAALGSHLARATGVTSVQASGLGDQGEMTLSPTTTGTWADVGVTSTSLLAGWKQVLTAWRTSLPASIPSALAIEEPLGIGVSNVLGTLIPWVHSHFSSKVWIQQNALRATTSETSGYWPILRKASTWTNTGWQMFGYGTENGDLETAFKIGLASHARYFQIYLADVVDPTKTVALEYLASQL